MSAKRDYAFEALAEVTGSDWTAQRGELNAGLASISLQEPQLEPKSMALADEIHRRAKLYREVFTDVALTPNALSKHWRRVVEESALLNRQKGVNLAARKSNCETCGGDRWVLVLQRPSDGNEEYAPCPDCSSTDPSYWRADGTRYVPPDSATVRELMSR